MRVLVTGAGGMLAHALAPELRGRGHEVHALTRAELDVTSGQAVGDVVAHLRPEVVMHCAAFTAVDDAETRLADAMRVNADATRLVAQACHQIGALLVFPSTDYVFGGDAGQPYPPDAAIEPINAYGRSKAAGEAAAREAGRWLVVRTSWLYGSGGRNFVDTITQRALAGAELRVVDDQIGRPTWTGTLARVLTDLASRGVSGTHHVTDGGDPVSWYGFAAEILRRQSMEADLRPIPSTALTRPAKRPAYSVLDCRSAEEAVGYAMPDWRSTLSEHLEHRRLGHGQDERREG